MPFSAARFREKTHLTAVLRASRRPNQFYVWSLTTRKITYKHLMFAEVIQRTRSCGISLRGFHWQSWQDEQESLLILIRCPMLSTLPSNSILETCIPEKICDNSCCCHRKPHRRPWQFLSCMEWMSRASTSLQLVCFWGKLQLGWVEQCSALIENLNKILISCVFSEITLSYIFAV